MIEFAPNLFCDEQFAEKIRDYYRHNTYGDHYPNCFHYMILDEIAKLPQPSTLVGYHNQNFIYIRYESIAYIARKDSKQVFFKLDDDYIIKMSKPYYIAAGDEFFHTHIYYKKILKTKIIA